MSRDGRVGASSEPRPHFQFPRATGGPRGIPVLDERWAVFADSPWTAGPPPEGPQPHASRAGDEWSIPIGHAHSRLMRIGRFQSATRPGSWERSPGARRAALPQLPSLRRAPPPGPARPASPSPPSAPLKPPARRRCRRRSFTRHPGPVGPFKRTDSTNTTMSGRAPGRRLSRRTMPVPINVQMRPGPSNSENVRP